MLNPFAQRASVQRRKVYACVPDSRVQKGRTVPSSFPETSRFGHMHQLDNGAQATRPNGRRTALGQPAVERSDFRSGARTWVSSFSGFFSTPSKLGRGKGCRSQIDWRVLAMCRSGRVSSGPITPNSQDADSKKKRRNCDPARWVRTNGGVRLGARYQKTKLVLSMLLYYQAA